MPIDRIPYGGALGAEILYRADQDRRQLGLEQQRADAFTRNVESDVQHRNMLMQQRQQERQQAQLDAQQKAELGALYTRMEAGDESAFDEAVTGLRLQGVPRDKAKEAAFRATQRALGITPEKPPGPITMETVGGARFWKQDGNVKASQLPQQPQNYGPNRDIELAKYIASLPQDQQEIALAALGRSRKGVEIGGGANLNDRQRTGLNVVRDNALFYAASISGKSREEVQRIYETGGRKAIADLVRNAPSRPLEGAGAMLLSGLPYGDTIVNAANADLVAAKTGGGAGVAQYQNPVGPITTPDFIAGEKQTASPLYPRETQAQMIEQKLLEAEQGLGSAPAGSSSGGWPTPPQAAIDALRQNPDLAAQFVEKYGRLPQGFRVPQ